MRHFFVQYADQKEIMSQPEFANFVSTAVFHNKDIQSFMVTELDDRLSFQQAAVIAAEYDLANEVIEEMVMGATPIQALFEWVK